LWLSPGHPAQCCRQTPAALVGVDVVWYWRAFRHTRENSFGLRDCIPDYLQHTVTCYRSPNLAFDEFWYRQEYPAVERLVKTGQYASGWEHYLDEGARKRYNPAFWFHERWYQREYPGVAAAVANRSLLCGFEHYLLYGIRENLSPSIYFNVDWYRERQMQDVDGAANAYPIVHYLLTDRKARACPVPFFDGEWYKGQYFTSSAVESGAFESLSAYEHYMSIGRRLAYSPSPYFNEFAYREIYPEVAKLVEQGRYASGFEHYVSEGPANGFLPQTHLKYAGVDYAGPAYIETYEQSLRLHLSQLRKLRELAES
jgi:hypothetical protein